MLASWLMNHDNCGISIRETQRQPEGYLFVLTRYLTHITCRQACANQCWQVFFLLFYSSYCSPNNQHDDSSSWCCKAVAINQFRKPRKEWYSNVIPSLNPAAGNEVYEEEFHVCSQSDRLVKKWNHFNSRCRAAGYKSTGRSICANN